MSLVQTPRRVMVGTDRSETAEKAVRWAAGFAERFDAELHIVQVILPQTSPTTDGRPVDLSSLAADLTAHARSIGGARARGRVVVDDDPAMAIVRAASEDAADVLVVGNAGMAGRRQFLLGNVPNRISHNARCTVVIVNTGSVDGKGAPYRDTGPGSSNGDGGHAGPSVRGAAIAAVLAKHGIRELFDRRESDDAEERRRKARRLRAALEELGPTFAKIGQILSTRPDLLPPEFIEELAQLRDRVAPLTEADVVRVMEQDLGVPWEDVFETIDAKPLAAGTIGQVHRAGLSNGGRVVAKVQRPEARTLITQDLALLKLGAEALGASETVQRRIDLPAVLDHLSTSLQQELDFKREAANAERLRASLAEFDRLGVPSIQGEYSTSRLLVMQDVAGRPLAEVPERLRSEVAHQLLESFYQQILVDGFFHADPHPGNLMWQPEEERLYFLDLGMVGEVSAETRELLILLLMAFWHEDGAMLTDSILTLSKSTHRSDLDVAGFSKDLNALMSRVRGSSIKDIQLGVVLQEMLDIAFRHEVPVPASLALTVKALAQMQLAAAQLAPTVDPFAIAARFVTRSTMRRVAAKADPKTLFYEAQKLRLRGVQLLEALERLVGARPGEKLEVNFRGTSLEETIWRAGRLLALGVVGGFALLASAIMTTTSRGAGGWAVVFGAAGLGAIAVLIVGSLRGRPSGGGRRRAKAER